MSKKFNSPLEAQFFGTEEISIANSGDDIIEGNHEWSFKPRAKYFSFMNYDECQVSINGSKPILLMREQGIYFQHPTQYIDSFVVLTDNVHYQVLGGF